MQSVEATSGPQPIAARGKNLPYPLTSGQQRIWFFEELAPGVPLYNESAAARLVGELNVEAMEQALNAIVARHEVLRTTIQINEERPIAFVHENWPLRMKRIDLSGLAPAQRAAEVARLLIDEPRRQYHLETEPGIRGTLVRLGPREHVFILMMHHLVCDWTSEGVLWRELSSAYRAISHGEPLAAGRLPIQHGDYAVWQQQRVAEASFTEDLAFWENNLHGAPELLELPSDRPRPSIQSYRGARQRFRLNTTLTEALRNCSRREKTSLFTVFAAALNTLLYRYTGSQDILLGIPIADRERQELQSMIGFLLHTQVLRTKLSVGMTFRELLARIQKGLMELYSHRDVPFDQVVSMLRPERSLSHSPIFQVMINWRGQDRQLSFIGLDGLAVESLLTENRTSKFDLTLFVTDSGGEIWLEAEYNTDLFDDDRIARMFGHYQTLLVAVAADPDRRLEELPLLMDAERRQLLVEWNATGATYPWDMCIHQLFELQVERTPEAVAVIFGDREVTYRELNEQSNQLAHHLRKLGVKADERVGICVERSIEMMVGVLGILKAGGAYVPLDPGYPADRLKYMLEDSAPAVLLTQRRLKGLFKGLSNALPVIDLITDSPEWADYPLSNPDRASVGLTPRHLAYVIYTSGSTGMPKGVMVEHRGLCNYLCWALETYVPTSAIVSSSLSFDATVTSFYTPLLCGGVTRLLPEREEIDGLDMQIRRSRSCGLVKITPSHLDALGQRLLSEKAPTSVGVFVIGGETLSASTLSLWRDVQPDIRLVNEYGPTETVVGCVVYDVPKHFSLSRSVPIGRPIANTRIYILDRYGEPVPISVAGEIHIGGVGVARGYLNRPELTAERFVRDPFTPEAGARMYKTGDLGRWLPDGTIEFLGRTDRQVKIRGFRIELEEIEAALKQHPGVGQCVVVAREDEPGDKRLVAYVVQLDEHGARGAWELRELLKQKLPEYMVPAVFVMLEKLPSTPNGKIDYKALPAPELGRVSSEAGYVAPRTAIERTLEKIWSKVLGIDRIGVRDNFFDLGGHSFRAMRLIGEVHKSLNQKLSVAVFFHNPTIEGIARVLQEEKQAKSENRLTPSSSSHVVQIRPEGSTPPLFLLHGVGGRILGFYEFVRHLEPDQRVYGIEYVIRDSEPAMLSLEDLAACYIKEIRNVQPEGPYYLLGYSFGGVLAFEIAQQFNAMGQAVGFLGMLDTLQVNGADGQDAQHSLIRAAKRKVQALNFYGRRVFRRPELRARVRTLIYATLRAMGRPIPKVLEQAYAVNWFAASRYQARLYPGCVTLFRAASGEGAVDERYGHELGWKAFAGGGVEVHEIPGTHHDMISEPNVQLLARRVTACLNLRYGPRPSQKSFRLSGRGPSDWKSVPLFPWRSSFE